MIFEGVNFSEKAVQKMSRDEFESRHIGLFWQDRDEATRKRMLGQAYDLIRKPVRRIRQKSGS